MLQFDRSARGDEPVRENLRRLFGVAEAPCDTQMRSLLDPVEPSALRPAFRALHSAVTRSPTMPT